MFSSPPVMVSVVGVGWCMDRLRMEYFVLSPTTATHHTHTIPATTHPLSQVPQSNIPLSAQLCKKEKDCENPTPHLRCTIIVYIEPAVTAIRKDSPGASTTKPHQPTHNPSLPATSGTLSLSLQSSFHLSLTVLVHYRSLALCLALDEIYHPFWTAFPNSPTRSMRVVRHGPLVFSRPCHGILTLSDGPFQTT